MNLLIVEDDLDFVGALVEIVRKNNQDTSYTLAHSRDTALSEIRDGFFDLILLDLNIPTSDGALDGQAVYGHSVFATARLEASGTPIIVLTGSSADEFIPSLLEHSEKTDVWGCGELVQMVAFHPKHKLDSFPALFDTYATDIYGLEEVELRRNTVQLSQQEERLVRIFANRYDGTKCSLSQIGGGLSGSKVLRLKVTNAGGALVHDAVCKIGESAVIKDEDDRYSRHVSRLLPEATPRKLAVLDHGAKKTSGVFYGLAEGFERNAFDFIGPDMSPTILMTEVERLLSRWVNPVESRRSVADIRRRLLSDEKREKSAEIPLPWVDAFEAKDIQVKWGCAHGDLHGLNILVSNEDLPILIDYGDAGEGPSSIDPLTLELSLFFHPDGPLKDSSWPTDAQARHWGDLNVYLEDCPCAEFIKACRDWALRVAAGEREVAAVAYSYLARQWKYMDVNKARVLALIEGVKQYYDQT